MWYFSIPGVVNRREVLKAGATALTSVSYGCIIDDGANEPLPPEEVDRPCWENIEGEEIDVQPLFNPEDEEEMVIPQEELLSEYERFEDEDNPGFEAYVYTEDYSHTLLVNVSVYPTVEEASERHGEIKSDYGDPRRFDMCEEALLRDEGDSAEMVFRKSNVVGHVKSYIPEHAPEAEERAYLPGTRVAGYSGELCDYWGGTSDFEDHPGFCREEVVKRQNPDKDE